MGVLAGKRGGAGVAALLLACLALVPAAHADPTPAPGWEISDFATGFPTGYCCNGVGPMGVAFNAAGTLYVADPAAGAIYAFGPTGGVAGGATQVNYAPIGGAPTGLAFGHDGRLYVTLATRGDVVEIDPSTGRVVRTVAKLGNALGIATDPLSGDLFVSQRTQRRVIRIENPASASPHVVVYASDVDDTGIDGLSFAPDGTLYVAGHDDVVRLSGTNGPSPPELSQVAGVPEGDGIAVGSPSAAGGPPLLAVNRWNGTVTLVDSGAQPPNTLDIMTGGDRGDFATVGPDGAMYATQRNRVLMITRAGTGPGPFLPTATFSPAAVRNRLRVARIIRMSRSCHPHQHMRVRLRKAKGIKVRRLSVLVRGHVRAFRKGAKAMRRLHRHSLIVRKLPRKRAFRVTAVATASDRRKFRVTRRYRTCAQIARARARRAHTRTRR